MPDRTLVLGDVHGAARALDQVLDRSTFDPSADRLICLGDICDGWPDVDRCFDRLLEIDHRTIILGNHDEWAAAWMFKGAAPFGWFAEGGAATVESYARRLGLEPPRTPEAAIAVARRVPPEHGALLRNAVPYLIEETGDVRRLFTHAGWNPGRPAERQSAYDLRLGRELWVRARVMQARQPAERARITSFGEVYIGHTPTEWREPRPVMEIWNLDQGAGWDGVLTLMDADTHEYWQSDPVPTLYPDAPGRR